MSKGFSAAVLLRIIRVMRRGAPLPARIEERPAALGAILDAEAAVKFAYVFGGAGRGMLRPLSDVDVAVYLDDAWIRPGPVST
jgi:predicted nucleotidyltransferase